MLLLLTSICTLSSSAFGQLIFMPQNNFQPLAGQAASLPIDLSFLFNNRAFGLEPNETNFDQTGGTWLSIRDDSVA
jgi:hypothetical protein